MLRALISIKKGVMCNAGTNSSVLRVKLELCLGVRDKMRIFDLRLNYYVKPSELGHYCTTVIETGERTSLKTGLAVFPVKILYCV